MQISETSDTATVVDCIVIGTFMLTRVRRALQWIADKITDWNYQGIAGHIEGTGWKRWGGVSAT